jgi:TonB family protein
MTTAVVPQVRLASFVTWIVTWLALCPAVAWAQAVAGTGVIRGTVYDSSGGVIASATATVVGSVISARTADAGIFRLERVPVGRVRLEVRRFGYTPRAIDVDVTVGSESRIDVLLASIPQRLVPVEVTERTTPSNERLAGFNQRRLKKVGYFVTRERIDGANSRRLTDLLAEVPGVRFFSERGGPSRALRLRGARCPPLVFLDGFPATAGEFDLDNIDPGTVEGIEVYPDMMSIPPELLGPRDLDRCGVIAIWSRPFRPRQPVAERGNVDAQRGEMDSEQIVARKIAFTASEVDVVARVESGTGVPVYPDSLWQAGVSGRAVLEFVVDSAGGIIEHTIHIVSSTHQLFAAAARSALLTADFIPARRDGHAVAQVVQLPFVFVAPTRKIGSPRPD